MSEVLNLPVAADSQWKRRFVQPLLRQRSAMVGLAIIAVYVFAAVFAPWLATHDPTAQDLMASLQGPSAAHWLGTDSYGQDLYSRLLYGAQLALIIGFASVALGLAVGVAIGLTAGLMGGRTEWVLMRIVDGLLEIGRAHV